MIHNQNANELLDLRIGSSSPTNVHLALMSTKPTFSAAPADLDEPTAADYARLSIVNDATTFPAATNGEKANGVTLEFPAATNDWGTIRYWALVDQTGAGKILYSSGTAQKYIGVGRQVAFLPGTLTIRMR